MTKVRSAARADLAPIVAAYADELAVADRCLAEGDPKAAAERFGAAMHMAFHRKRHFDRTTSALARDPGRFVDPLRNSTTARALRAPRGRALTMPPRPDTTTGTRPTRVLVVTRKNANFLGEIRAYLEENDAFESRFFDFAEGPNLVHAFATPEQLATEILTAEGGLAGRAEGLLRPHLDWADVVFVEWCTAHAVVFTMIDPRDTRVILRLHSYEAFTPWPHLVDFTRIDDLLFVSDHLRDLGTESIPALGEPDAPRCHVLPLGMRLEQYGAPKPATARFTLALTGWGSVAKDPLWALEVLRALRERDPRYRLLLIGSDFDSSPSRAAQRYGSQLHTDLDALVAEGAVRRLGRSKDVASLLVDVGVMLSSSVRESFHAGLVEGAASGAVPVVRDWPFFVGRPHGARTLFPADWVVGSVDEAVERILATTRTEQIWRSVGEAAARYAVERWDWDLVKDDYGRLLRGEGW